MQKKRNQKRNQIGYVSQGEGDSLTPSQAEILGYLQEGLEVTQIAVKRKCSKAYVRKVRIQLREKGLLKKVVTPGGAHPVTSVTKSVTKKRVHAQRFEFDIVSTGARFRPGIGQHLSDGTWVQCFDSKLLISCPEGLCFEGDSVQDALLSSFDHWNRVFRRLEHDLDVVILKDRKVFRVVYTEVASEGSKVASSVIQKEGFLRIFDSRDGKLRLSFDMSKGRPEHEVHHAKSWFSDDLSADRHFNDILDHPECPTLPELASLVREVVVLQREQLRSSVPSFPVVKDRSLADYFG